MDQRNEFHSKLTEALSARADNLERTAIVKLREHLQGFEAGVSAMYKFLINKGLMQDDPYRHERTVTEIQVPPNDPFTDADAQSEISIRFSQYVSQWEFMVNIFHVSLSNLSLKKIRRLMDLLDWIRWSDFSPNSGQQITRATARIVARVSQMNDPMAGRIMSSSAANLRELSRRIKEDLKIITVFLRERYKWKIREELVDGMKISPEAYRRSPGDTVNNIKFEFSHRLKGLGWYRELILELLEEDFSDDADKRRAAVLDRLKVTEQAVKKKTRKGPDDRTVLLGIAERMGRGGEPIRSAVVKMNENSRTIQERRKSLGERLSEIFSSMFRKSEGSVKYEISIRDAVTGASRRETIDYARFSTAAMKRARSLQELLDSNSAGYRNARAAGADQLAEYIRKFLAEMKLIHRRLEGLDAYFQSREVPVELRDSMKGSGLNLKNLKFTISETMKALNEFRIRKEEEEQLRKLGIED